MAPLYQHTNRQKIVIPPNFNISNYSVNSTSSTFTLTNPTASSIRVQTGTRTTNTFVNVGFHGFAYNNQGYSSPKTITIVVNPYTSGTSGVIGVALFNANSGKALPICVKPNESKIYSAGFTMSGYAPSARWTGETVVTNTGAGTTAQYAVRFVDDGTNLIAQYRRYSDSAWVNLYTTTFSSILGGSPTNYGLWLIPSHNTDSSDLDATISSFTIV